VHKTGMRLFRSCLAHGVFCGAFLVLPLVVHVEKSAVPLTRTALHLLPVEDST
jgi:hypothetical protein